jgi:hypothetical protein
VQQGLAQVVLNASNFLRSHIVVLGVLVIARSDCCAMHGRAGLCHATVADFHKMFLV